MITKLFTNHPASVNQTYFAHLKFALSFGFSMIVGGLASIIHAIFPFLFKTTGSRRVFDNARKYIDRKSDKEQLEYMLLEYLSAQKKINS